MIITTALAGVCVSACYVWYKNSSKKGGPRSVGYYPIVGSFFHIEEPLGHQLLTQFPNDPLVEVRYGLQPIYYLNSAAAIREAFVEQADKFVGRPASTQLLGTEVIGDVGGIIMTDGDIWKEYRRFTLKTLRDFGLGRKGAEEIISLETQILLKSIDKKIDEPIETSLLLSSSVSNVICQFVFGSRLAAEDPHFDKVLDILRKITQHEESRNTMFILFSVGVLMKYCYPLVRLMLSFGPLAEFLGEFRQLIDYCKKHIVYHKNDLDLHAEAKDYIEAHLQHQHKLQNDHIFSDTRLALAISDLFVAGTDTTSHTLRWAILFMITHPRVADNVFQEIQKEIGTEREPQVTDKQNLHYVQATIEEIHRLASLVPEGVQHRVTEETATVGGFTLRKDDLVSPNLYGIHHNPNVFPDPKVMKPERHLKADGTYQPHEDVMPFGVGKRACLGESLAKMELFIFFTSLMQNYTFEVGPKQPSAAELIANAKTYAGGIRAPDKHNIIFHRRQN